MTNGPVTVMAKLESASPSPPPAARAAPRSSPTRGAKKGQRAPCMLMHGDGGGDRGGGGVTGRVWGEVGVVAKKNDGKKNKRGGDGKKWGVCFSMALCSVMLGCGGGSPDGRGRICSWGCPKNGGDQRPLGCSESENSKGKGPGCAGPAMRPKCTAVPPEICSQACKALVELLCREATPS